MGKIKLMYELQYDFREYYRELDPGKRRAILDRLEADGKDDGANELREELFRVRYVDEKNPGNYVDRYLWQIVNMLVLSRNAKYFPQKTLRELKKNAEDLGVFRMLEAGESGKGAFYWEARNAFKRYLSTTSSSGYRRKVFGLMQASSEDRLWQTAEDAYLISGKLAKRLEIEEQMSLFCAAVSEEYCCMDDDAPFRFEKTVQSLDKKK